MMNRRISLFLITALLFLSGAAWAASPAQSHLQAKQQELTKLIKQPKSSANDAKLKKTFDALLDYDTLAKDSLGAEWDKRSPEERKEFQALLTKLVQAAYTKNIRDTLDYEIKFTGSSAASKGELVKTIAQHKTDARAEKIHINYLVHKVGGAWRVYDIITENSSLVKNYKGQFRRIIDKKGFSELLTRMRKKAGAS